MMIYKRTLTISPDMKGKRLFLFFEGVNSVADVLSITKRLLIIWGDIQHFVLK